MTPVLTWSDLIETLRKYTGSKSSRRERNRAARKSTSRSLPLIGTKAQDSQRRARITNTMKSNCTEMLLWVQVAVQEQNSSQFSVHNLHRIWRQVSIKEKALHTVNQYHSSPPSHRGQIKLCWYDSSQWSQLISDIWTTNESISDNYPPGPTTSDTSHTWLMHWLISRPT